MRVVTTFHQPSSVTSSLKCTLARNCPLGHLVVATPNRLEVSSIHPEGLKSECSLEIWGRVLSIRAVASEDADISNVLVLTDHPDPKLILLKYSVGPTGPALVDTWSSSLYDRSGRHAEFVTDVVVHPKGRIAVASCYVGKLKIVCFKKGKVEKEFEVQLPEMNLVALNFLYNQSKSKAHIFTLALVHIDHKQRIQLLARELDTEAFELSSDPSYALPFTILSANHFPATENPLKLVPVPAFDLSQQETDDDDAEDPKPVRCRGGVIVLGGKRIAFYELADKKVREELRKKDKRQAARRGSGTTQGSRAEEKDAARENKKIKPRAAVKWPWSEVTAWCSADSEMRRFLIGDNFGRLSVLALDEMAELVLIPLGNISSPTTLAYLSSQVLYVGSHCGDSQLVRISPQPLSDLDAETLPIPSGFKTMTPAQFSGDQLEDEDFDMQGADRGSGNGGKIIQCQGNYLEVLHQSHNIAPIVDAVLADPEESGQPQIVACSGLANSGALHVVRTGADFQELAVLKELSGVISVWPIRTRFQGHNDAYILASTVHNSYLLRFDGRDSIVCVDGSAIGLITTERTLALANVPRRMQQQSGPSTYVDSSLIVQVTPKGVNLVEYDDALNTFTRVGSGWFLQEQDNPVWKSREIVAAHLNPSQFVLALSRGTVVVLNLKDGQLNRLHTRDFFGREIAAVSCAPLDPAKHFSPFVVVSFWGTNTVAMLRTQDPQDPLAPLTESVALPALPRSVLLHNFGSGKSSKEEDFQPHVLAGLTDGSVVALSFKNNELKDQKVFSLGTAPVSLSVCEVDGKRTVFASGSRSSVFFWDKQRLRQSLVMLKNVAAGSALNTTHFPSCQILATPSSLVIGQIRGVDKMQIRSIPMGYDNPWRIAYHPSLNVFGVAVWRVTPNRVGETERKDSAFYLYDSTTFNRIGQYVMDAEEEIVSVHALPPSSTGRPGAFVVGTVHYLHAEVEPSHGRLILFDVDSQGSERELKVVASYQAGGCVYALSSIGDCIVAAINTKVGIYAVGTLEESIKLSEVAQWNHSYFLTSLAVKGHTIAVGDAISSVALLEIDPPNRLKTIARDYSPLWPVTLDTTKEGGLIGANNDCNLFTYSFQESEQARKLERSGIFHVGEVITKFVAGGLSTQDTPEGSGARPMFETEHLFFTSAGRIALVHSVSDEVALPLTAVQRNMTELIVGAGETNHAKWRAPVGRRGRSDADQSAVGFLDGDFLEQFLTHDSPETLLQGGSEAMRIHMPVEQVEGMLEKLQSLH